MSKRRPTKAELKAQRDELLRLRGERRQKDWAESELGVPERTYIRYELGQRAAPEAVMRLARIKATRKRKTKNGS